MADRKKKRVEIGDRYFVCRDDGFYYLAEMLAIRPVAIEEELLEIELSKKRSRSDSFTEDYDPSNEGEYDVYVNYDDFDRRMDEWVRLDRVDFKRGLQPKKVDETLSPYPSHVRRRKEIEEELASGHHRRITGIPSSRSFDPLLMTMDREHEEITVVR